MLYRINALCATLMFFAGFTLCASAVELPADSASPYHNEWRQIREALNNRLPKTALDPVGRLYARAVKDKNHANIATAAFLRAFLTSQGSPAPDSAAISLIERELRAAPTPPARAIIASLTAYAYEQYLNRHRWQLRRRTTGAAQASDFTTWDVPLFSEKISALHQQSLEPRAALQAIPLSAVRDAVVFPERDTTGRDTSSMLRPTVYDLLARRAIAYFTSQTEANNRPASDSLLNAAFAPANEFIGTFSAKAAKADNAALPLFAELLRFHAADAAPDALLDAELARLDHVRSLGGEKRTDTLYKLALERIITKYRAAPAVAEFFHALAEWYNNHGNGSQAMQLSETAINDYPASRGAALCRTLKSRLLARELDLTVEPNIRPDKPALLSVRYAQLTQLYFRLVKVPCADLRQTAPADDDATHNRLISQAAAAQPVREWQETLPASPNYRPYTVQTALPALPVGRYILLAATRPDFTPGDSGAVSATSFIVSSIAVLRQEFYGYPDRSGWYVADMETGRPRAGVAVEFFTSRYDYSIRREHIENRGKAQSDATGFVPQADGNFGVHDYSVLLFAISGADTAVATTNAQSWRRTPAESSLRTYLYTDRTLYRPGQSVLFKGIVVRTDDEKRSYTAAGNEELTVVLTDPNGTRIAEQRLRTNEFGSYAGTFALPHAGMKGFWNIADGKGNAQIRVEEYKRPKFAVTLKQPEGAVTLGTTITVRGSASTFAGSAVSGAKVRFRVVRNVRFHFWKHGFYPSDTSEETIAADTTTTDKTGAFSVTFPATPDAAADPANSPVFIFAVSADITDAAGETHSAELSVSAGFTSVLLDLAVPEFVPAGSPLVVPVFGKNLNERPAVVSGSITLENVLTAPRIRRETGLPVPDALLIDPEVFARDFPEDSPETTAKDDGNGIAPAPPPLLRSLTAMQFTTNNGSDSLFFASLKPGKYRLAGAGTDPEGRVVNIERTFIVYEVPADAKNADAPKSAIIEPKPLVAFAGQTSALPGQTVRFVVGSGYADARALLIVEKNGNILRREWLTVSEEFRSVEIPVGEELRGGFFASVFLVHSGRTYQERFGVLVPWTNKDLHIATAVFRDKVTPGAKEEWRLTVRSENAGNVAAELLAAMYDASLDAIAESWEKGSWAGRMFPWQQSWHSLRFEAAASLRHSDEQKGGRWFADVGYPHRQYPALWPEEQTGRDFEAGGGYDGYSRQKSFDVQEGSAAGGGLGGNYPAVPPILHATPPIAEGAVKSDRIFTKAIVNAENSQKPSNPPPAPPRTNLNETAFFFPQLRNNDAGEVAFSFTMPEALTTWRFMALAHSADLRAGTLEREVITQKELMALPNTPRFLREGDTLTLPATIANLTDRTLNGTARLQLFDAETMKSVNELFDLADNERKFTIENRGNAVVSWRVAVPAGIDAITWRVTASAGDFSDGEEAILPVLPNSTPVTETLPVAIRGGGSRTFTLKNLADLARKPSPTLKNRKLTFEFAENPVWYAVQALPLLMEYPHECAEQLFNRFAANAIAGRIAGAQPNIAATIRRWAEGGNLASPLEKNESLKSVMLNETPWAAEGKSETERKQRIARLLDLNAMNAERAAALRKLRELQQPSGGFAWFAGMRENRTMTQYILAGIAHVLALDAAGEHRDALLDIARAAIRFAEYQAAEEFARLKRDKKFNPEKTSYYDFVAAQYLYIRSYFNEFPPEKVADSALQFYRKQAAQFWQKQNLQTQALTAIALWQFSQTEARNRETERAAARGVIASLRERAVRSGELGMYWVMPAGWGWTDAPIETQALLIEAFELVGGTGTDVEDMRYWLLRNKQTHDWRTTKATAEACYALLLRGKNVLENSGNITATVGGKPVQPDSREAGTGYYSVSWSGAEITPAMATVTLSRTGDGASYGGLYWQYTERTDRIREQKSAISVERTAIIKQPRAGWEILARAGGSAYVGARLTVRLTIRADREMEYVHIKDARAAGFEPAVQTSGYEWLGGTGYYRSPSDGSVSFFVERLPRGTTVIEYDLFATHEGAFSDGIATVQSLYAPEFGAHSRGGMMRVER